MQGGAIVKKSRRRESKEAEIELPKGHDSAGRFLSGDQHPRATNLEGIEARLVKDDIGTLSVIKGTIRREKSIRKVDALCSACGQLFNLYVDNLLSKKTTNCRCQRRKKYHSPNAKTLGQRYDAMVQRCERDTHVSSKNYKDRGIQVRFRSREHFIFWALEQFPETDFVGLDFDRIDNDGHYEPSNLRLVTRSENLLNRRPYNEW